MQKPNFYQLSALKVKLHSLETKFTQCRTKNVDKTLHAHFP